MIISNSEAETFSTCERMHYYQFALGLAPKRPSEFIKIGLLGHKVLEVYYKAAKETNNDRSEMFLAGMEELSNAADHANDEIELDIVSLISSRFQSYHKHFRDTFRVVDVEGRYEYYLGNGLTYGMTLDLLVEETAGPLRGQHIVIDHKYCYNFQTPEEVSMNSQLPKYIFVLREKGFNITRGMLNQIRYRGDVNSFDKLFRRHFIKPSPIRCNAIMEEQRKASEQISPRLVMPVADYRNQARRSMSKRNCGSCQFRLPCSHELDSRDREATEILALDYQENSYGYRG